MISHPSLFENRNFFPKSVLSILGERRFKKMGASQALKRIPRIKFPQRHSQSPSSGSGFQNKGSSTEVDANITFFSGSKVSKSLGGKASDQPKRTPVSSEEIEAIMLGGCF